ncbi:MAG: hypothetical protein KF893_04735 [Caldilineaceae bacterium]|nr:hypothetical protein [Caldilineaceae bacterium]
MPMVTGGEALVSSLIGHRVETIFALPGVQNDYFFNAVYDAGDRLRVIGTRHEQGAAYMALGYALASQRVGVYSVVPGPGFLNTTAALSTAYACNAKVLCLTGQIRSDQIGRGYGMLHEIPDQLGILRSLTKWAERIATPQEAPRFVAAAFNQLHSDRPQPVGLEIPPDVLSAKGDVDLSPIPLNARRPAPDLDAIYRAADLLGKARNPVIFVGGGAQDASEAVRELAEMVQAPVVASYNGRGVLDSRYYLSHTIPAGHRLWARADVILAIGTRLARPLLEWGVDADLKLIRIDIDPTEHTRVHPPAVSITADADEATRLLVESLRRSNIIRPSRKVEMVGLKAEIDAEFAKLSPQIDYLRLIREELPEEGLFVDELTQVGYVGRVAFPVYRPRTYITNGYQGTLGWGVATALGVKVANPDKPVLSVAGDGGFLFTAMELATAVQHKIATVTLVFNDGAYGNVRRMQKENYGNRVIATDLHNPDFVRLTESFGAQGIRAQSFDDLRRAIRQGFASDLPTVIEIPVGEMPSPWGLIHPGRAR